MSYLTATARLTTARPQQPSNIRLAANPHNGPLRKSNPFLNRRLDGRMPSHGAIRISDVRL